MEHEAYSREGVVDMPRGDGTGPEGKGPMTGRGLGNCNPKNDPTDTKSTSQKRGLGRRLGHRLGFGRRNNNR